VAGPVTPDAAARDSQRRTATRYALTAVVLAGIGAMLMALDLATRPPCYPGYVRLIDVELLGAIVILALVTISIVVYWRARRGRHFQATIGVAAVLILCLAFANLWIVATLVDNSGAQYDSCWTF
jgi:hypothetical protein